MNAIDLLIQQHREVQSLFEKYERATDNQERQQLFDQIADALAVHATIEEKVFYPAARKPGTQDMLDQALQEHLEVKRLIAELLDLEPSEGEFDLKMSELLAIVHDHVQEEENDLFPDVKAQLGQRKLEAMGKEMQEMAEELAEGEPRFQLPSQIEART
jgi:hemerythrin superfamily protein